MNKYFESYGLRLKLLTVKSSAENHLIDFENDFHKRNVGQIQVNKYVCYANINSTQTNTLRQQLSEILKNHISINATNSLSVNKFNSFSYRQLYDLKKEIDKNILITNISDDQNKIFGTFLDIDYAFENLVKPLALKKEIPISELVKPLTLKL